MELSGANQLVDHAALGILPNLGDRLVPLFPCFSLRSVSLQVFQLQDVAMLNHRIAHQVGHEEEAAIAVVQLHFGSREIVRVQIEQGIHEPLQIALALNQAAN